MLVKPIRMCTNSSLRMLMVVVIQEFLNEIYKYYFNVSI